jgi:hypothetical protein
MMTRMILRGMITSTLFGLEMTTTDEVRRVLRNTAGSRGAGRMNNGIRQEEMPGTRDSTIPTTIPTLVNRDIAGTQAGKSHAPENTVEEKPSGPASMPRSRPNNARRLAKVCIPGAVDRGTTQTRGDPRLQRMEGIKAKDRRECSSTRTYTIRSSFNRHHLCPPEAGATRRATRKRPAGMDIRTAARHLSAHRSLRSLTRIGQDRVNIRRAS